MKPRRYRVKPKTGPHVHKGVKYLPGGEAFEAFPQEIEAFKDKLECLDQPDEVAEVAVPAKDSYVVVEAKDAGLYDIINKDSGKKLTEKPLSMEDVLKVVTEDALQHIRSVEVERTPVRRKKPVVVRRK